VNIDMKNNLSDKSKMQTNIEILKQGQKGDFWQLILESLEESVNYIRLQQESEEFENLPADQYKLQDRVMKNKIKYLEHMQDLPQFLIEELKDPNVNAPKFNPDPYTKAGEE